MTDGEDQVELYTVADDVPELDGPVLVYYLDGFVDAGGAGRMAVEQLLALSEPRDVAEFDVDSLTDYRSRRPNMIFDTDRWVDYETPRLTVQVCEDAAGTRFLVMTGPEPDRSWEHFATAVTSLIDRFGVRLAVGAHGIPMAVPHTRDTGLTPHGSRTDLFGEHRPWISRVQVPASAAALLEYRLIEGGHDAIGFAAHVPHYLAQSEYPQAAVTVLRAIAAATGLRVSYDTLDEAADKARVQIDEQVTASADIAEAVRKLEQQYDAVADENVPSGDEIAADIERFLAERDDE